VGRRARRVEDPQAAIRPVGERRQQRDADARHERERQVGALVLDLPDVRVPSVQSREDGSRMLEHEDAAVRQLDRVPPARMPDYQPVRDDALEARQLVADRRLGVAEVVAGSAQRTRLGDRDERGQVAHLERRPALERRGRTGLGTPDRAELGSLCAHRRGRRRHASRLGKSCPATVRGGSAAHAPHPDRVAGPAPSP
jgi:hypothetical protein